MANRLLLNSIALEPNRWNRDEPPVFNLFKLLPLMAESGFSNVELWEGHISSLSGRTIQDIRSLADSLKLSLCITGLYPTIHLAGPASARELDRVRSLMTDAKKLGSDVIKFFVGSVGSASVSDEQRAYSIQFLQDMNAHAEILSVQLAGEFHMNTLFDTVDSTRSVLEEVPGLNVCFQPFDFSSTSTTLTDFSALGDNVIHIHLQGRQSGEFATLRDADINYPEFFQHLANRGYAGDFGIEFVVGCVTDSVDESYLSRVLAAAETDAQYVRDAGTAAGLSIDG